LYYACFFLLFFFHFRAKSYGAEEPSIAQIQCRISYLASSSVRSLARDEEEQEREGEEEEGGKEGEKEEGMKS
jgi:hypothetical protein